MKKTKDNYQDRRNELSQLNDQELHNLFWELTNDIVQPIVSLSAKSTSPSIERSVLLRMGFNSIISARIVENSIKHNLIGKGCGNLVLKYAGNKNLSYMEAGKDLSQDRGWDNLKSEFNK